MKKILSLMMAMVVAMSVLTSCKSKDNEEDAVKRSEFATNVNYFTWKAASIVNDNLLVLDSYERNESYVQLEAFAEAIFSLPVKVKSANAEGEYEISSFSMPATKNNKAWYQLKGYIGDKNNFRGIVSIKGKNPYDIKAELYNVIDQDGGLIEKVTFEYHGVLEDISMLVY